MSPPGSPDLVTIVADQIGSPPGWALLQRQLMSTIEEGSESYVDRYGERGGARFYGDCVDDLYEQFYNWGLLYAIGGGQRVLDMSLTAWNAITRYNDDGIVHRVKHPEFRHGRAQRKYNQQIHNEYYNQQTQSGAGSAEWHHMGEGNQAFYNFGLADPTISENVRRARRFAAMFIGEDPEAPNFDTTRNIFRSPIQTSEGPYIDGSVEKAIWWLQGSADRPMQPDGLRATVYPRFKKLDVGWENDPRIRDDVVDIFEKSVLRTDTPHSNAATALVTNAYLYTSEDRYRQWVLDYVEGWLDRIERNNGIVPDNIGWSGTIGEHRDGQWWGGMYGWSSYNGCRHMFNALTVGAECALLLSGDYGYLDLIRSQVRLLADLARKDDDGQLVSPWRHGHEGWAKFEPLRVKEPVHIWHNSMSREDYEVVTHLRENDTRMDWNDPDWGNERVKGTGDIEKARFNYYDGGNPGWPEKALSVELQDVLDKMEAIRTDDRDVETIITENEEPMSPVNTKALIHTTMGGPQTVYNGGLNQGRVRYYDGVQRRPGLPPDTAALVDSLAEDSIGIQLVNTSTSERQKVIVQAGTFAQHSFTDVRFRPCGRDTESHRSIDATCFAVELPPMTTIRLEAGQRRFVNKPSYAFPWHGDAIPVPFQ